MAKTGEERPVNRKRNVRSTGGQGSLIDFARSILHQLYTQTLSSALSTVIQPRSLPKRRRNAVV